MIEGNLALFVKSNHRRGAGLTQNERDQRVFLAMDGASLQEHGSCVLVSAHYG